MGKWLLMVLYFTVPTPHNENGHPIPYYKWGQYVSSQEECARLAHDVLAIKLPKGAESVSFCIAPEHAKQIAQKEKIAGEQQ